MKYQFIEAQSEHHEVALICDAMGVERTGFYAWKDRQTKGRALKRRQLAEKIKELFLKWNKRYGAPKIHQELLAQDIQVSRNTVAKIMAEEGLRALKARKFKRTTDSNHNHAVHPNLLQQNFRTEKPNQAWVTDITYIETREGWLYLAIILDLYSRKVIGWSMDKRMKKELTLKALHMAMNNRDFNEGLIHHSDQGSQYASKAYQRTLSANGIRCSMSRKGNCWDNAVAESFFATLKTECCFNYAVFETRADARTKIFEYIEGFYNSKRRHSYIGYKAPSEFEAM